MKIRTSHLLLLCVAISLAASFASCTVGGTSSPATQAHSDAENDEASPAEQVLDSVYDSVVNIEVAVSVGGQTASGVGSGIVYTEDGYILTNDHVVTLGGAVSSGQRITVTFSSGEALPATLVGTDARRDVAALKVDKTGLHPVTFATPGDIQLAEWAIVIGSPLDFRNSVTLGIVSGLDRSLDTAPGQAPLTGLVQVDAPISPGNSGGGCFDINGHFIGMPEVYLPPAATGAENVSFCIPADVVLSVAQALVVGR